MEGDGGPKTKLIADGDWLPADELQRPFDAVSSQLAGLGALSVDDFLSNAPSVPVAYDISFLMHPKEPEQPEPDTQDVQKDADMETNREEQDADPKLAARRNAKSYVWQLRQASLNVFGSTTCLDWGYIEGAMPLGKQCILTITRPSGATRSYKSETGFTRKQDARGQAAQIAIDMGAIDFIVSGDSDALKAKKGLLLNPLDVELENLDSIEATAGPLSRWTLGEEPLKVIEECCQEWRAGKVKPHWVPYNDYKNHKKLGIAMRISLNAHVFRAYSVDPVHNSLKQAKIACSRAAIDEGVLDFIRYGNGQTEPAAVAESDLDDEQDMPPPVLRCISLQEFYESLPQPFPEDVGEKNAAEINAPAWLNLALQSARGGRLASKFLPVMDLINRFHGSVLRIERPGETRTFVVDPQFPKRSDAKSAVCLLAMSQGVGQYIRGLKEAAENKLPADKRKLANEKILQIISAECGKVRHGNRLTFTFETDRDAYGCTVKADISPNVSAPEIREYSVPTEYPSKADAKAAVACLAAEQGLVDLLRFKGGPLPPDYVPFWEAQVNGEGDNYVPKRKEPERDDGEGRDRKKRKKGNNGSDEGDVTVLQPPPKVKPLPAGLPPKPVTTLPPDVFPSSSRWKGPRATGSRGLVPTNEYAPASRQVGQDRSGNRSGDIPYYPEGYYSASSSGPPASRNPYPRMHAHAQNYDGRDYRPGPGYQDAHGYAHPDVYGNLYSPFSPPAGSNHYPVSGYRSPPPAIMPVPAASAQPPMDYPSYYGTPSTPTSASPHSPYGQYGYPPQYTSHYSHVQPYSRSYHSPAVYPLPTTHDRSPHHMSTHRDSHPYTFSGYPQGSQGSRSPTRPPSPPRHSHHVSYPSQPADLASSEGRRPVYTRRRHSIVTDIRNRDSHTAQGRDNQGGQYDGKTPPPPVAQSLLPNDNQPELNEQSEGQPSRPEQPTTPKVLTMNEKPPHPPLPTNATNGATLTPTKVTEQLSLRALYDFCAQEKINKPKFFHQTVPESEPKKYFVWAEKDSHRLELPNQFANVEEGYEKLSKRVLAWERSRLQKPQGS